MPRGLKEDNQYYGKYFENAVCCATNGTEFFNNTEYDFTPEEEAEIQQDAIQCAQYIGGTTAEWVGDKTSLEDCDAIIDGEHVEIKYVSAGNGTYFNTSIYYFSKFGLNFKDYMEKYGVYDAIDAMPGYAANRKNNSPVSQPNSSAIRHNPELAELYYKVVESDARARANFIHDIIDYFSKNPASVPQFVEDMLTKNSGTSHKSNPDRFVVYNYTKHTVSDIDITKFYEGIDKIRNTDKGIIIGNIRVAISWQNGIGLNNPTIRVFLA